MTDLSITIVTFNEELNIERCLGALRGLSPDILVVDSFSTDRTVELCKAYGCRVIQRKFSGYADQKQFAVSEAKNDWVMIVDADEMVSPELRDEIGSLMHLDSIPFDGYEINFSLCYLGRIMKHSGVGNEHKVRLFNRRTGIFDDSHVHEKIIMTGKVGRLKGRILHYSYTDLHHHFEKTNRYTTLAAEHNSKTGKSYYKPWVAIKLPVTFLVFYIIRGGIRDGYPGFMWSFFAAVYSTIKVAKTIEMTNRL